MALVEIKKSDYQQGPLQLAIGPNSQLLAYIQEYGEQSFRQLLGLYYDDAVANDRQKYTDLFNGIHYTDEHGEFNSFVGQGLAYVVRRFIYFYFLRDTQTINSDTGTVSNRNENAVQQLGYGRVRAEMRYREAVNAYNCNVLPFLMNFRDVEREVIAQVGNTLEVSDTLYLSDGDAIMVGESEAVVSNVTATTFDIDIVGSFVDDVAIWAPFEDIPMQPLSSLTF